MNEKTMIGSGTINDWLQYRRGRLFAEGKDVARLAERYGTPLFILSESELRRTYRNIESSFRINYPKSVVAYSYKTNYLPEVCRILHAEGAWGEVVSGFELQLCRDLHVAPAEIVFNGPSKDDDELRAAIGMQIGLLNVDSLDELDRIERIARSARRAVNIGIRIALPSSKKYRYDWSKFGISVENGDFLKAVKRIAGNSSMSLKGLHMHYSDMTEDVVVRLALIREMTAIMAYLNSRHRTEIRYVDIGGGFNYPKHIPLQPSETPQYISASDYARILSREFRGSLRKYGLREPTLVLEPGRVLVAGAFILVTKVMSLKRWDGVKKCIVDGGINLVPHLRNFRHKTIPVTRRKSTRESIYDLYGPLCTPVDRVALQCRLPRLECGDLLAICDCGAYSLSFSTQFIKTRPAVVRINGSRHALVRKAETYDDIFRLDTLPS